MEILVAAVSRMRGGPEAALWDTYCARAERQGRGLGISAVRLREIPESRAQTAALRKKEEAGKLIEALPADAHVVALDERGTPHSSGELASIVKARLGDGTGTLAFLIGGPDGHGETALQRCDLTLSLGAMTWPHLMARAMLAEQIYRAVTILGGHPYHRE